MASSIAKIGKLATKARQSGRAANSPRSSSSITARSSRAQFRCSLLDPTIHASIRVEQPSAVPSGPQNRSSELTSLRMRVQHARDSLRDEREYDKPLAKRRWIFGHFVRLSAMSRPQFARFRRPHQSNGSVAVLLPRYDHWTISTVYVSAQPAEIQLQGPARTQRERAIVSCNF
jgi:hypothetical protein